MDNSSVVKVTQPIRFPVYRSLESFEPWLRAVLNDVIALRAESGTPEIVGGSAAFTLILRRDTLPIRCAEVRVQRDRFFSQWLCRAEVEYVGDASTLRLYLEFLNALANGLPDDDTFGGRDTVGAYRQMMKAIAAHYTKTLPPLEAKPEQPLPPEDAIDEAIIEILRAERFDIGDRQIAGRILTEQGIKISRSAVTKRRNRMGYKKQ